MAREKRFTFVFKPVYQYDFTQEKSMFGTEIGIWYHTYDMIYLSDFIGWDFGFLFNNKSYYIYVEAQLGAQFAGISIGLFVENDRSGIQYTLWVNYFIGFYLRGKQDFNFNDIDIILGVYFTFPTF